MLHLPVLRWGSNYDSLEVDEVVHFLTGEPVAKVSQANAGIARRDLKKAQRARDLLCDIPVQELIEEPSTVGENDWSEIPPPNAAIGFPEAEMSDDDIESIQPLRDFSFAAVFAPSPASSKYFESLAPADATGRDPYLGTNQDVRYHWAARNLSHRTLYFQDMPLERYGYSYSDKVQPLVSALDFIRDAAISPIRWGKEQPCELHYVLGYERSGSCAPPVRERWAPSR